MSEKEYEQTVLFGAGGLGYCTSCDEITDEGVEPDAEEYQCPECEEYTVMGAESALICGHIEIEEGEDYLLLLEFEEIANRLQQREITYNMRVRLNPHHSKKDREYEQHKFHREQRQDWLRLKDLYVNNKKSIINEARCLNKNAPTSNYIERRDSVLSVVEAIDKVIEKEMEEIVLGKERD